MDTFLADTVAHVHNKYGSFDNLIFVVPSIRAATHLRIHLSKHIDQPIFSPKILGIEAFISEISQLQNSSNTALLFTLYKVYQESELEDKDDFFDFTKWATTLLADFDEIDRYLIDSDTLFDYLTELKKINTWNLDNKPTKLVLNYVSFAKKIKEYHNSLGVLLLDKNSSYQGLRYRAATERLPVYLEQTKNQRHVFIGFNALNTAEGTIIQNILENGSGQIFWDLDTHFLEDPQHSASYFINGYLEQWAYFKQHSPQGFSTRYLKKEKISLTGIPKNVSQAKYVGHLLKRLYSKNADRTVALVLADESLLPTILNTIPKEVGQVNITMGYPLAKTSVADFFSLLLEFCLQQQHNGWNHKQVLTLFSHPITKLVLDSKETGYSAKVKKKILENNYTRIYPNQLHAWLSDSKTLRFTDNAATSTFFIELAVTLLKHLKTKLVGPASLIATEAIKIYDNILSQLKEYLVSFPFLDDLKNLKGILGALVSLETVSFKGSPIGGLQIMGMLETRALDFETTIISSVNEGILPAGKSHNSFIPYDVKTAFGLPTFRDKDAIYTYHFYRLLQRAKSVYITYNTEPDVLEGGEKSRFISQLLTDKKLNEVITHSIATPEIPGHFRNEKSIAKSPQLIKRLQQLAATGFSPTSLTTYIKNPYTFYKQYVLKIRDAEKVEETMAHNTFGTILHDSLEVLYTPFVCKPFLPRSLEGLRPKVENVVRTQFQKTFGDHRLDTGQLLIVFKVLIKYIFAAIDFDIAQARQHDIVLTALEQKLELQLQLPNINVPILLKGKLDRIETVDGEVRIVDYKTGNTNKTDVTITNFEELLEKENKAKAFQLLCYSLLYTQHANLTTLKAGILPIKNLGQGILEFGTKTSANARNKDTLITRDTLSQFTTILGQLIQEILDPTVPFVDTESDLF